MTEKEKPLKAAECRDQVYLLTLRVTYEAQSQVEEPGTRITCPGKSKGTAL